MADDINTLRRILRDSKVIAVVGRGFPGLAHTAAARAGVLELSRTLAYEWGPRVRVNCVLPGPVMRPATTMARRVAARAMNLGVWDLTNGLLRNSTKLIGVRTIPKSP